MTSKNIVDIIIKINRFTRSKKEAFRKVHPLTRDKTINMQEFHKIGQRFSNVL